MKLMGVEFYLFSVKEVKSKLETLKFSSIKGITMDSSSLPTPKLDIVRRAEPLFDNRMSFFFILILCLDVNYFSTCHIFFAYLLLAIQAPFARYETPHLIYTDTQRILIVWPMCDGRDVNVSIRGTYLIIQIHLAPLAYVFNSFCFYLLRG